MISVALRGQSIAGNARRGFWVRVATAANPFTVNGATLILSFPSELLAGAIPDASRFTAKVNGADRAVSFVAITSGDAVLTLALAVTAGQGVTVAYTNPAQVTPPTPPGDNYVIPGGATVVTNGAELQAALSGTTISDIVLENGTYDKATHFTTARGHRLWARNALQAVLTAGLDMGGNFSRAGWQAHGLKFNVTDTAKDVSTGSSNSMLETWGSDSINWLIEDCEFDGGVDRVPSHGFRALQPTGGTVRRVQAHHVQANGVRLSNNNSSATLTIAEVSDIDCWDIYHDVPGSGGGTDETGLWVGHPVVSDVHRVRVRRTGWMGVTPLMQCADTNFYDIDVDELNLGGGVTSVYAERSTNNIVFERYTFGPDVGRGFNGEWDGDVAGNAAMNNFHCRHGRIIVNPDLVDKSHGFHSDHGGSDVGITDTVFAGQEWSCAGWNVDDAGLTSVADFTNNDWSQRQPGCARVSDVHLNSFANGAVPDLLAVDGDPPRRLIYNAATRGDVASIGTAPVANQTP